METVSVDYVESLELDEKTHLVDVLSKDHFNKKHIPNAVNIPLNRIASEALEKFSKDDKIIVYCKDKACGASPKAAEKLEDLGFTNVKDFEGGLADWEEAGNRVES